MPTATTTWPDSASAPWNATRIIDGSAIAPGDVLIGIASSGPHSNGYSLIRKVLELSGDADIDGVRASERLLTPPASTSSRYCSS